eukprot:1152157-Pelagomonas_calceolata.AAC.2
MTVPRNPAAMAKWSRRLFSKEEIPGSIPGSSTAHRFVGRHLPMSGMINRGFTRSSPIRSRRGRTDIS